MTLFKNPLPAAIVLTLGIITGAILLTSCSEEGPLDETTIQAEAVVTRLEIEGGCWVLDTGSETYDPVNLGEAFQRDGLEVVFTAKRLGNVDSICQVGPIVEIVDIRERHTAGTLGVAVSF